MPNEFSRLITRRTLVATAGFTSGALLLRPSSLFSSDVGAPIAVEPQPYFSGVNRALEDLAQLGAPIAAADAAQIAALSRQNDGVAVAEAEKLLDRYTLTRVTLQSEGIGRTEPGGAKRTLIEQGWRMFLVRVENTKGKMNDFGIVTPFV